MYVTNPALLSIPPTAGAVDYDKEDGRRRVFGWLFVPGVDLQRIDVHVDSELKASTSPTDRLDVLKHFRWEPRSLHSGFELEWPWDEKPFRIDVLGFSNDHAVGRFSSMIWPGDHRVLPTPPDALAHRVARSTGHSFRLQGLKIFTDFEDQITSHFAGDTARILDWGCGCGRVSRYWIHETQREVTGVDLDEEAIAWCQQNLTGGQFLSVPPDPPLPFPEATFDVVVASSVLTHLDRENQDRWLPEIQRVLVPGGLFLPSTHGEFAYRCSLTHYKPWRWQRLKSLFKAQRLEGILDGGTESALDAVAPEGYYRNVYQTRQYCIESFRRWFEVLEYIERGLHGHQDLAVLRRP